MHVNHTCCRVFGSGAVITCFNDLNKVNPNRKSNSDILHEANAQPLSNHGVLHKHAGC